MASPFRLFRKYLKPLLVVFGVMLMFAFVIGDALVGYLGGARRGRGDATRDAGATAVSWDGGSLTNAELDNLVSRRRILNGFIQGVEFAGRRAAFEAGVEPQRLRVEPIVGPETPQQGVEQHVVQTRLFAQAARDAGMHVADTTIVQYLDELGRRNVSRDDMRAMLSRLQSGNNRVSIDLVIEALREEMLARNYLASHQFALETVTPQQRWDDWLDLNDRVVIEAAAMPIEQFLVDVPEPSDSQLAAFFDEHKDREPQPDFIGQMEFPSPTPGFRIPRKIGVQYIQANYDQYLARIENEITDDEIETYYEDNKDPLFIKADTGLIDDSTLFDEEQATDAMPAEDSPSESPPADETDEAAAERPAESTSPAEPVETPDSAEAKDTPPPATSDEPAAPGDSPDEPAPSEGDQSSRGAHPRAPFRLATFLQDAESETPPNDEQPADGTSETADGSNEPQSVPSESSPADSKSPADSPETTGATDESPAATTPSDDAPKEFQPLDEVRDVIRRELAGRRAAEEMNDLVNRLASQLNSQFNTYFNTVLEAQEEDRDLPKPPPELADLAPLANEHGLEHGKVGPTSWIELRETPVGKSGSGETGIALWRTLFGSRELELYQPVVTVDIDGNRYVAMKTSDTPGRVPELAEVKDQVVEAWKRQQAAELALKNAEEQAEQAEKAGSTLADFFADNQSIEVVRTDPFSKYTGGDVALVGGELQRQPFRLSEPDGVVAAGRDFLRRVFEIDDGEVAAILNHDHSIAYVVRIVEHQNSPDELRSAYLAEANTWPGLRLMTSDHARKAAVHLVNDVVENANLDWQRPSDQTEQDERDAG